MRHQSARSRPLPFAAALFGAALAVALSLGCGRRPEPAVNADSATSGSAAVAPATRSGATGSTTVRSACPRTGLWAACSVEKRLEQSGFVLRKIAPAGAKRPGFSVAPAIYSLGRGKLEVFLYADGNALERDWAGLDTVQASPKGKPTVWDTPPTLVRSANLAALFFTNSPEQAERLTLALTAGAPQPGSTRSANTALLSPVKISTPRGRPSR